MHTPKEVYPWVFMDVFSQERCFSLRMGTRFIRAHNLSYFGCVYYWFELLSWAAGWLLGISAYMVLAVERPVLVASRPKTMSSYQQVTGYVNVTWLECRRQTYGYVRNSIFAYGNARPNKLPDPATYSCLKTMSSYQQVTGYVHVTWPECRKQT